MYPEGGATVAEIRDSGNSKLTLALGSWSSDAAGALLQEKCGVPCVPLKIPVGLKATDDFIMALKNSFGVKVPHQLTVERGQVVDTLIDTHFHYQGKKVAVVGDPDLVVPLTEFLLTMGMVPVYVMTGHARPAVRDRSEKDARGRRHQG